jgi:hypothetical protein
MICVGGRVPRSYSENGNLCEKQACFDFDPLKSQRSALTFLLPTHQKYSPPIGEQFKYPKRINFSFAFGWTKFTRELVLSRQTQSQSAKVIHA